VQPGGLCLDDTAHQVALLNGMNKNKNASLNNGLMFTADYDPKRIITTCNAIHNTLSFLVYLLRHFLELKHDSQKSGLSYILVEQRGQSAIYHTLLANCALLLPNAV